MTVETIIKNIMDDNSSQAKDDILAELNSRSSNFVTSYRKAAIADMFGGCVVEDEDEDDDIKKIDVKDSKDSKDKKSKEDSDKDADEED